VGEIKLEKCIETTIGLRGKLRDERRKQVAAVLLVGVSKIKVKISHGGRSTLV
jgi:hypothetical protein